MTIKHFLEDVGNGIMYCCSMAQVEQVLRIASFGLSVAISVLILISRIIDWWKKAKADGKITKDELKEGIDIVTSGINDVKDQIDSHKKEEKK